MQDQYQEYERECLTAVLDMLDGEIELCPKGRTRIELKHAAARLSWHAEKEFGADLRRASPSEGGDRRSPYFREDTLAVFHIRRDGEALCLTSEDDGEGAGRLCSTCCEISVGLATSDDIARLLGES